MKLYLIKKLCYCSFFFFSDSWVNHLTAMPMVEAPIKTTGQLTYNGKNTKLTTRFKQTHVLGASRNNSNPLNLRS